MLLSRNTKPNCLSTNKVCLIQNYGVRIGEKYISLFLLQHRMTAMHLACYHGYLGIIKMMIASKRSPGMDIDEYNQRLRDNRGALLVATQFDSGFFKKLLLGRTKVRFKYPVQSTLDLTKKSNCVSVIMPPFSPQPPHAHTQNLMVSMCVCAIILHAKILNFSNTNFCQLRRGGLH